MSYGNVAGGGVGGILVFEPRGGEMVRESQPSAEKQGEGRRASSDRYYPPLEMLEARGEKRENFKCFNYAAKLNLNPSDALPVLLTKC